MTPLVVTKDGWLVHDDGTVERAEALGLDTAPAIVIDVVWADASEDEREQIRSLGRVLDGRWTASYAALLRH